MTKKKRIALECLWEEAKMYSKLYYSTTDEYKRHKYISHFRSPIFDETNIKLFQKDFISFLKNYCYTIKILSEENVLVAQYLKENKEKNFLEAYKALSITICDSEGKIIKEPNLPLI